MSSQRFGIHSHGLIQTARGLCTDEAPHVEIDTMLARAVEQIKDVEEERNRYKAALEAIETEAITTMGAGMIRQIAHEALHATVSSSDE